MRLDIEGLRALKTVHEVGGVTRAAESLALTQSAISHKIRRMEEALDCRLLTRRRGASQLTEAGARLLPYADRIVALHDEALTGLKRPAIRGEVRIGITEDLIHTGLIRAIGRVNQAFPAVRVVSHVDQSLTLQRKLKDGTIDFAAMQVFEHDARPDDIALGDNEIAWIIGRDVDLSAEGDIPFVAYDPHCFFRQWAVSELAALGRSVRVTLECPSTGGILDAVAAGMGISLVSRRHLQGTVGERLRVLRTGLPVPARLRFVLRGRPGRPSPAAAYILSEIQTGERL